MGKATGGLKLGDRSLANLLTHTCLSFKWEVSGLYWHVEDAGYSKEIHAG